MPVSPFLRVPFQLEALHHEETWQENPLGRQLRLMPTLNSSPLITVSAQWKKTPGELHVTAHDLHWTPASASTSLPSPLKIARSDIAKALVSAGGTTDALMKLVLSNGDSVVLRFSSRSDRSRVHSLLTSSASPATFMSGKVAGVRGIASSSLWLAGACVPPPPPSKDGKVHYKVTTSLVHRLFVASPNLHATYSSLVPLKLIAAEFWSQFFQIYREPASNASQAETQAALNAAAVALRVENNIKTEGESEAESPKADRDSLLSAREYKRSQRYQSQIALIRTVNRHGSLIATAMPPPPPPPVKAEPSGSSASLPSSETVVPITPTLRSPPLVDAPLPPTKPKPGNVPPPSREVLFSLFS